MSDDPSASPAADAAAAALPIQPPYLALANAFRSVDVQDIAEIAGMRVAMAVMQAQGVPLPGEYPEGEAAPDLSPEVIQARLALARRVLGRKIDRELLAISLLQAPDIAMAVAADPSNPGAAVMSVDVAAAWLRNWTDFALVIQG